MSNFKAFDAISKELGSFIKSKSSTFACGGDIPIVPNEKLDSATLAVTPVTLRWDSPVFLTGISKISFPIYRNDDVQRASLVRLLKDCQPASFGYKGNDVHDESYRKAAKMDPSAFSVDFCPYSLEIVNNIAQVLLPNAGSNMAVRGVRAELYKLNFRSLVVSLPCHHEGGQLVVRHAGHSMTFDWGTSGTGGKASTSVQWAAFYSDCEHEVLEVTEGHRITLAYNLYYAPTVGDLAGDSPAMNVKTLPLYSKVQDALRDPLFMVKGGYLGVCCQHAYAHSTREGVQFFPYILKGADMAVYTEAPKATNTSTYVGNTLRALVVSERGGEGAEPDDVLSEFAGDWLEVNWLIPAVKSTASVNFVHLTYGNEPGADSIYSYAALLVMVPPAGERLSV